MGKERKEHRMGGGDGKRRKREKVGQSVQVCAAQIVDIGTGRLTTLLIEQL